ncbi:MAG: ribonuclease III [Dehalococcoidales bacterium]|nr:MAG: ribonuclease III [Dehalococcoidales bacterium]
MDELATVQKGLGIHFNDPSLLRQALIHGSFSNENPTLAPVPNERLEFLGDAVLDLVVAARIYLDFPQFSEGEMTKLRAMLVRRDTLARVAKGIGLGNYLYLGKGEDTTGGRDKPANLAGAVEAVIGAVYLDQGLETTTVFIQRLLDTELAEAIARRTDANYKSELQELLQARQQQRPTYHLVEATGPEHDRMFTVEVRLGDTVLGRGSGRSKKTAETVAAQAILRQLQDDFTR